MPKISRIAILASLLVSCHRQWYFREVHYGYQPIGPQFDSLHRADPIDSLIRPYREVLIGEMSQIIGWSPHTFIKASPECNLGNWVADVLLDASSSFFNEHADLAVVNMGSLRVGLIQPGNITLGQMYELMPFDNRLSLVRLSGAQLDELGRHILKKGGWPISKGSQLQQGKGQFVFTQIANRAFNVHSTYVVAMPDYLANGGDGCRMLKSAECTTSHVFIRDLLIHDIKSNGLISDGRYAGTEGRVIGQEVD